MTYVMKGLVALRDQFDIAFACDTDHDRHGVVTKSAGLLSSNQYLSVCIAFTLFVTRRCGVSVQRSAKRSSAATYRLRRRTSRTVSE